MSEFVLTLIASTSASSVLAGVLIWLTRTWLSERLHQSIRHEYNEKLESLKARLSAEADKNTAMLRASIEKESERLRFATASISQTQKAAIERKLDALDTLWDAVLAARENVPAVMGFIDILTVDEYRSSKDHPHFQALVGELSPDRLVTMFKDNVGSRERVRPYVGEYLWALITTYQAVVLRVALLLHWGVEDEKKLDWHLDHGIQQLLQASLTNSERAEFDQVQIGKVGWLQRNFEHKILAAMQVIISGQHFGDEALQQAQRMEEKVQELKPMGSWSAVEDGVAGKPSA